MDEKRKRPTERGKTTVTRERPRTPSSGPKAARPRTGTAASREAARRERRGEPERSGRREAPARREPPKERETSAGREPAGRESALREEPVRQRRVDPEEVFQHRSGTAQEPGKRKSKSREEAGREAPKRKKKKPHRVYNTNFGFKFAIMLSVVAVIVLSMVIFFKVKHINVILPTDENGETKSYYTAQEVADASGVNLDDNLLSLSKATVAARIYAALPYVNEVQIKKQLPGTVVIRFSEFQVTYGIQDEQGGWWLMSREGRILESADEQSVRGHLTVTGMPIKVPELGDEIKPAATEGADMSEIANKQKVALDTLEALEKTSFIKQVERVDVSTSYDLTLWWAGGRYEIKLGTTERLDYKLQYLQTILQEGSINNKSGTLDLTFNEDSDAHFLPFQ